MFSFFERNIEKAQYSIMNVKEVGKLMKRKKNEKESSFQISVYPLQ